MVNRQTINNLLPPNVQHKIAGTAK